MLDFIMSEKSYMTDDISEIAREWNFKKPTQKFQIKYVEFNDGVACYITPCWYTQMGTLINKYFQVYKGKARLSPEDKGTDKDKLEIAKRIAKAKAVRQYWKQETRWAKSVLMLTKKIYNTAMDYTAYCIEKQEEITSQIKKLSE